jgi:antitoxin component of MazEF toxin-antitoxin module
MTKRFREIKKYGNTFVIKLEIIDMKDLNLKIGDLINLNDMIPVVHLNNKLKSKIKNKI